MEDNVIRVPSNYLMVEFTNGRSVIIEEETLVEMKAKAVDGWMSIRPNKYWDINMKPVAPGKTMIVALPGTDHPFQVYELQFHLATMATIMKLCQDSEIVASVLHARSGLHLVK